jgi:hypothetical protein
MLSKKQMNMAAGVAIGTVLFSRFLKEPIKKILG